MRLLGYCILAGIGALIRRDYRAFCRELDITLREAKRWAPR